MATLKQQKTVSNQPMWSVHGDLARQAALDGENKTAISRGAAIAALVEAHFEFAFSDPDDFHPDNFGLEGVKVTDLVIASGDRKTESSRFKAVMSHIFKLYIVDAGEVIPNPIFFKKEKDAETEEMSDRKFRAVEKTLRRAIVPAVYIIQKVEAQKVDYSDLMTFDSKTGRLWLPLSLFAYNAKKQETLAGISDKLQTVLWAVNGQKFGAKGPGQLTLDLNSLEQAAKEGLTSAGLMKKANRASSAGQGKVTKAPEPLAAAAVLTDRIAERGFGPDARSHRGELFAPDTAKQVRLMVGSYLALYCVDEKTDELDINKVYELVVFAQDQINQVPPEEPEEDERTEPAADVDVAA